MVKEYKEPGAMESMKGINAIKPVFRKPVHHAANKEDYDRILNHIH